MKPSYEIAPMYLYVMSADGRLDASPCKVGISRYPSDRLETVRRGTPWADDTLDFVAVYEGDPGAIITLEDETKRAAREHALDGSREWFGFQASVLVNALDDDPRCERAPKEVTETTSRAESETVRVNVKLPRWMREQVKRKAYSEGEDMSAVVRRFLQDYLNDGPLVDRLL